MVPVPSEHVFQIMSWVLFRSFDADAEQLDRDAAALIAYYREAGDYERSLIALVSSATVNRQSLQLRDLADDLGVATLTVTKTVHEMNMSILGNGRPVFEMHPERTVGAMGRTGNLAHVSMRSYLAQAVRAGLRATVAAPLASGSLPTE